MREVFLESRSVLPVNGATIPIQQACTGDEIAPGRKRADRDLAARGLAQDREVAPLGRVLDAQAAAYEHVVSIEHCDGMRLGRKGDTIGRLHGSAVEAGEDPAEILAQDEPVER